MKVYKRMHGYIQISQKDKRHFAKMPKKNYQYSVFRLIVIKINPQTNNVQEFMGEGYECERDIHFENNFDVGEYLIYIDVDWESEEREFVLSCYADWRVEFKELLGQEARADNLIDDIISLHQVKEDQERINHYSQDVKRTTGSFCGYIYFFYENNSKTSILKEEVTMQKMEHL